MKKTPLNDKPRMTGPLIMILTVGAVAVPAVVWVLYKAAQNDFISNILKGLK